MQHLSSRLAHFSPVRLALGAVPPAPERGKEETNQTFFSVRVWRLSPVDDVSVSCRDVMPWHVNGSSTFCQ